MNSDFLVNFIGIGAGKSGSTWLYNNIIKHPEICDFNPKEINYFSRHHRLKGFDWYKKQFLQCEGLIKGEFSIDYMSSHGAAQRIFETFPNIKLIAILRRPEDRIFSDFCHAIRKGDVAPETGFSEYINDVEKLSYGIYHEQLKPFYTLFAKEQIKIIFFEEATKNPEETLRELYGWLGVEDPSCLPPGLRNKVNEAAVYKVLWIENILARTSRLLNNLGMTLMVERMKKAGVSDFIRAVNKKEGQEKPAMDKESARYLKTFFRAHNERLFELTGHKPGEWD